MTGAVVCWAVALLCDLRGWRWPAVLALGTGLVLTGAYWPEEPKLAAVLATMQLEAAFLSVWLLVLLPILDRRLDRQVIVSNLWQGGVALAGVASSVAITLQLRLVLPDPSGGAALLLLCFSPLHFAGLALCRPGGSFGTWAYPAWAAGWLVLVLSALPELPLPLAAHGLGLLVLTYGPAVLLWQGTKRQGPVRWLCLLAALSLPYLVGLSLS